MPENTAQPQAKKSNKTLIGILAGCGCLTAVIITLFVGLAFAGFKANKNLPSQTQNDNFYTDGVGVENYNEPVTQPKTTNNNSNDVKEPDLFITIATTFGEVTNSSLYKTFNGSFYEFSHPKQWSVDSKVGGGFDVLVNAYNSSQDQAAIYAFSNPTQKPPSVQAFMDSEERILNESFPDNGLIIGQYITFTPKADFNRTVYLMPFTFTDVSGIQKYGAIIYAEGSAGYVGINFYGSEEAISKYFYTFVNSIQVD